MVLRRPLPRGRDDLRPRRSARRRPPLWHPDGALLHHPRPQRRARRRVLFRPVRARRQAGRRVDGRRDQPPPRARRRAASGRVPDVQPVARRSAASPRRSRTTRSSRSSTSSATGCTSCSPRSTSPASPASRAWNGTRWSCPRSSWRTSAGNGTCSAHMSRHVGHGSPAAARALRPHDRRRATSRAVSRPFASSRWASSTCVCTPSTSPPAATPRSRRRRSSSRSGGRSRSLPRAPYDRFLESFSHVFAGGYAAGYYSYKWAEVLSADACSLFEEQGVLSPDAGARFRDEVLSRGGSRPALESFVAFRGRPPQLDALLRHNGMVEPA